MNTTTAPTLHHLTAGDMAAIVNGATGVFYRVQVIRTTATLVVVSWGKGELKFSKAEGREVTRGMKKYRLMTEADPRYATWLVGNEVARVMVKVAHQAGGVRITRDRQDALRQLDLLSTLIDQAKQALGE